MGCKFSASEYKSKDFIDKLKKITKLDENELLRWYEEFEKESKIPSSMFKMIKNEFKNTDTVVLDRGQFIRFYSKLRQRNEETVKDMGAEIFRVFDENSDKKIDFEEFIIGYLLTSEGTKLEKLNYLFQLYDRNDDNVIKKDELKSILEKMVTFAHIFENTDKDIQKMVNYALSVLDANKDGEIDKNEFINGLQKDAGLYSIYMNPF